ncbi:MAG: GntR family transcriptional regulator [Acidimicrobiales bacterium]|nr:GntR family transcriptional regulator [Acidimicrobiales bacterium]
MRQTRYQTIAEGLRTEIESGAYAAGRLLPSEAELSERYAASRVTVRRALEVLRDEGLVDSRQGFGWFVAADPVRQSLARLGTIEAQLAQEGIGSERRVLDFRFVPAPPRVRQVLGCDTVLRVRRLNLADGEPFAVVTVWCPEEYGAELSRAAVERSPFYELMGVALGGATQTIGATAAAASEADLLGVPVGSPVLRCERITRATSGEPVLVSEHVFPAHLTEFVVDLPHAEASMAPSGLRLVD